MVNTAPRYRHPQHTQRHRTRPAPSAESRGEAASALMGSQVVGCRVTWGGGGMHTHTHTHSRSLTHPHTDSRHPMSHAQTQPLAHSFTDSFITQIHIIIRKQINTQMHRHIEIHLDISREMRGCAQIHILTATRPHPHRHVHAHTHTQTHAHTQSPGI